MGIRWTPPPPSTATIRMGLQPPVRWLSMNWETQPLQRQRWKQGVFSPVAREFSERNTFSIVCGEIHTLSSLCMVLRVKASAQQVFFHGGHREHNFPTITTWLSLNYVLWQPLAFLSSELINYRKHHHQLSCQPEGCPGHKN